MDRDICDCKIGSVTASYALEGLDQRLLKERREEDASLRDLARTVNVEIVAARLERADTDAIADAAMIYDLLTDDGETSRRIAMTDALAEHDIEWETLTADFVSYQTVRRHFNRCLDRSTDRTGIENVAEGREVLTWAREHHENVLERTLRRLARVGALQIDAPEASVNVMITCESCGGVYDVEGLLADGACACHD